RREPVLARVPLRGREEVKSAGNSNPEGAAKKAPEFFRSGRSGGFLAIFIFFPRLAEKPRNGARSSGIPFRPFIRLCNVDFRGVRRDYDRKMRRTAAARGASFCGHSSRQKPELPRASRSDA